LEFTKIGLKSLDILLKTLQVIVVLVINMWNESVSSVRNTTDSRFWKRDEPLSFRFKFVAIFFFRSRFTIIIPGRSIVGTRV